MILRWILEKEEGAILIGFIGTSGMSVCACYELSVSIKYWNIFE
jgi:hypothetical protein